MGSEMCIRDSKSTTIYGTRTAPPLRLKCGRSSSCHPSLPTHEPIVFAPRSHGCAPRVCGRVDLSTPGEKLLLLSCTPVSGHADQGGGHPEDAGCPGAHRHPQQRQPDAGLHLAPPPGMHKSVVLCGYMVMARWREETRKKKHRGILLTW